MRLHSRGKVGESGGSRTRRNHYLTHLTLAGILGVSLVLNLSNLGFPPTFHADEPNKIEFLMTGTQDFHHPVLMLQLVRTAAWSLGLPWDEDLVLTGRVLMGVSGAASVLLVFLLARQRLSPIWALGAAFAVAVSPILVVHAHYFDERTLLTTFVLAAVVAFFRFVERPAAAVTIWLGVAMGLAWSSHFEAILLVPLFALAPLMGAVGPPRDFFARLFIACVVAGGVFLAVNWPLLQQVPLFVAGVRDALGHAASGHDIVVHGHYYWFAFHLLNSLAPGMTWPALGVALGGVVATAWSWNRADFRERWILAAAVVFYLAVEMAPLKPWPDYSGYVVPVVPLLLYLAAHGGERLLAAAPSRAVRALAAATVVSALILYPLYDATRLVRELEDDTRTRAAAWLEANPANVLVEQYGDDTAGGRPVAEFDIAELVHDGVEYVVASSFTYDRFRVGSQLPGQRPAVYRAQGRYDALFAHPYIELAPAYRSFAFSNPTIRIVDLRPPSVRAAHPMPRLTGR